MRPNLPVLILLADHWGINPNELLLLAGAGGYHGHLACVLKDQRLTLFIRQAHALLLLEQLVQACQEHDWSLQAGARLQE